MIAVKPDGETRDSYSGCPSGHPPRIAQRGSPGGRRHERGQPPPRPRRCGNSGMHAACSATQAGNRPHRARAAHTPRELSPSFLPPLLQARGSSRTAKATPPRARRGARYRRAPAEAPPANRHRECGGRIRSTPPYRQAALRLRAQSKRLSASLRYQASGRQRCRRRPRAHRTQAARNRPPRSRLSPHRATPLAESEGSARCRTPHRAHEAARGKAARRGGRHLREEGLPDARRKTPHPRGARQHRAPTCQDAPRPRVESLRGATRCLPPPTSRCKAPSRRGSASNQPTKRDGSMRTTRRSHGRKSRLCRTVFGRFQYP